MQRAKSGLPQLLEKYRTEILADWVKEQLAAVTLRSDLMNEAELREQSTRFLDAFRAAVLDHEGGDIDRPHWRPVRDLLAEFSRSRARQGFSPGDTATFIFSLKQPVFNRLAAELEGGRAIVEAIWDATRVLDKLGLYTVEVHQKAREEIILRQQEEMFELSAPVVELWHGILGLPLIGVLDSKRTQLVMESLLQRICETQAEVAILDITGVPTVDTLTAQHLLKTVTATRMMGAECIISGVRPQIAQTMVQLGIDFAGITTKSTLAGALALAFKQQALSVRPAAVPTGRE